MSSACSRNKKCKTNKDRLNSRRRSSVKSKLTPIVKSSKSCVKPLIAKCTPLTTTKTKKSSRFRSLKATSSTRMASATELCTRRLES